MLFNKNDNGSQELYRITGKFHAATAFDSIRNEVIDAENQVRDLIGDEILNAATEAYNTEEPTVEQQLLLEAVRRPIACLAVQMHAGLSGLSHGEGGRKIQVDENEKIPFEWMIDRDDQAMRERYYRALDGLFSFLSGREGLWKKCPLSSSLSSCIVKTVTEFETVYPIDGSHYTFFKILPLLLDAQESLQAKTGFDNDALMNDRRAVKYIVLTALATALRRWSIVIFPTSVARQFSPSYQGNRETAAASMEEIRACAENFTNEAAAELRRIKAETSPDTGAGLKPKNDPRNKFFTV